MLNIELNCAGGMFAELRGIRTRAANDISIFSGAVKTQEICTEDTALAFVGSHCADLDRVEVDL